MATCCCNETDRKARFGLGAMVPKEVQDGTFTKRIPTSHERLLENLIGKKAAKAHLAAKSKHTATTKPQKPVKSAQPKEESDEEEEGRAATFKSKRQKRSKPTPAPQLDSDDEDEESRAAKAAAREQRTSKEVPEIADEDVTTENGPADEDVDGTAKSPSTSQPVKAKPKSYLDELLGEKSKKKKKKKKGKEAVAKTDA